jgi:hypothetical protein
MSQPTPSAGAEPPARAPSTSTSGTSTRPIPAGRTRRDRLRAGLALGTLTLAVGAGLLWWHQSRGSAAPATMEPAPATTSILLPPENDIAPAATAASAPGMAASEPVAPQPNDEIAPLRTSVDQLAARVAALEETDRQRVEQIATLRAELGRIVATRHAEREKAAQPDVQASAVDTSRPRRAGRPATASAPADAATVLAVDLWGGQPSVVVAKQGPAGTELRFLGQGESQGRVTLKHADVGNQRATFATPSGEFTMSAGER